MTISPEEALSLLRRWFNQKIPLKVKLVPSGGLFTVRMIGFISALSEPAVIVADHTDGTRPPQHYIEVNSGFCGFEQHGITGLTIVLSDNTRLSLFKRDASNA
jgi:hypothetical protein